MIGRIVKRFVFQEEVPIEVTEKGGDWVAPYLSRIGSVYLFSDYPV